MKATDLLVEPQCWAELDYRSLSGPNVSGRASWTIDRSAAAHGLSVWFDCETASGVGFSNSPASSERHVYGQAFFPWPEAVELTRGDQVSVRLRADYVHSAYVWSWDTCVTDGHSGQVKIRYRQSSFIGTPLSEERLRRRKDTFVPEPTEEARIDGRILALMDQKLTLKEIALRILAEFPSRFEDSYAVLTRTADLSERYSK